MKYCSPCFTWSCLPNRRYDYVPCIFQLHVLFLQPVQSTLHSLSLHHFQELFRGKIAILSALDCSVLYSVLFALESCGAKICAGIKRARKTANFRSLEYLLEEEILDIAAEHPTARESVVAEAGYLLPIIEEIILKINAPFDPQLQERGTHNTEILDHNTESEVNEAIELLERLDSEFDGSRPQ